MPSYLAECQIRVFLIFLGAHWMKLPLDSELLPVAMDLPPSRYFSYLQDADVNNVTVILISVVLWNVFIQLRTSMYTIRRLA